MAALVKSSPGTCILDAGLLDDGSIEVSCIAVGSIRDGEGPGVVEIWTATVRDRGGREFALRPPANAHRTPR